MNSIILYTKEEINCFLLLGIDIPRLPIECTFCKVNVFNWEENDYHNFGMELHNTTPQVWMLFWRIFCHGRVHSGSEIHALPQQYFKSPINLLPHQKYNKNVCLTKILFQQLLITFWRASNFEIFKKSIKNITIYQIWFLRISK